MDLVPLLYPGVRRIHGVYRVYPFYESDLLNKASHMHLKSIMHQINDIPRGNKVIFLTHLACFSFLFLSRNSLFSKNKT